MSNELADRLMRARAPEDFLREQGEAAGWEVIASLKSEVDRLVGCDLGAASRLAERIEALSAVVSDRNSRAFAEASRARVLHHSGRHDEANSLYSQAVRTMRAQRLSNEAAAIQLQQVDALRQMGRYTEALKVAREARRVLSRTDPVNLAKLETNVGNVYYRLDRYQKALDHYDRAGRIFEMSGDDSMRAFVDFNRSNILAEMDRPDEALTLLESSAARFDECGQPLYSAQARHHLAYIQFLRGHYNAALALYYRVREDLDSLNSPEPVAWCNLEIGEILLALNAFDQAVHHASLAHSEFTALDQDYEAAQALMVRGLSHLGIREYGRAASDLSSARDVFVSQGLTVLVATADLFLADLAFRKGNPGESIRRAESAKRVFSRQGIRSRIAQSQMIAGRSYFAAGDLNRAARLARAGLRNLEGLYAPGIAFQCSHILGLFERARGRRAASLSNFQSAVDAVESMRGGIAADEFKATFLKDKIEVYEDAIAACLDGGTEELLEEAFRLVESSKSRALADLLARYLRDSQPDPSSGSKTRNRLLRLIEELNWYSSHAGLEDDKGEQRRATVANGYYREVLRCERQIAHLFNRLEGEKSAFAEIQRMPAAGTGELRTTLHDGETAVEYFATGDAISAFVATRDNVRVARDIASRSEVARTLAGFRFQIDKFNFGQRYIDAHFGQLKRGADEYLARLHRMLMAPLRQEIETSRIVVIPHGLLHYVPFHALRDEKGYIVDSHEFSYAPSALVLGLCRRRGHAIRSQRRTGARGNFVALGVSHRDTPSIDSEIRTLRSLFRDSIALTGYDATSVNLVANAPRARFLHLASHGYFRRDNPMFSFLRLVDRPLNFYSLLDLELRAELVTLSACHTGVNEIFPGDELHGLMRGFLYAGAPALVASLWAVNDGSTAEFMHAMYLKIKEGHSKRTALKHAQRTIRDSHGHPYYWAPFILMGDPE